MITVESDCCARVLSDTDIDKAEISRAKELFEDDNLFDALNSPSVQKSEKYAVVDRLFSDKINTFIKVMIDYNHMHCMREIFEAYEEILLKRENILKATLYYVTKPDEQTVEKFADMLKKKFDAVNVVIELKEDKDLIGGYILQVGDTQYDKSVSGTIRALQSILIRR